MEKRIQDELNILTDIIVDTVPVEQIILFGSYAGGTPNADSDLDVYVVISDKVSNGTADRGTGYATSAE